MPRRRSSAAQASEAGPAPMRATARPVSGAGVKGSGSAARVERVHGEALEARDLDRLLVEAVHHAGAFAQDFHRAGAGTAGAQDVGVEDGARGAGKIAAGDFLDEAGNVDVGGAGGGAGGIEAVETTIGFGYRCLPVEAADADRRNAQKSPDGRGPAAKRTFGHSCGRFPLSASLVVRAWKPSLCTIRGQDTQTLPPWDFSLPPRTGAPYLARFSRDVGFHEPQRPLPIGGRKRVASSNPGSSLESSNEALWNPTSREKRARCGAPVIGCQEGIS